MIRLLTALLLLLSCVGNARASDVSPYYGKCLNQSHGTTVSMRNCYGDEIKRQDKRLNEAYSKLKDIIKPERQKHLLDAQKAWIAFRDADCIYQYNNEGTIAMLTGDQCVLTRTLKRADELEDEIKNEESEY